MTGNNKQCKLSRWLIHRKEQKKLKIDILHFTLTLNTVLYCTVALKINVKIHLFIYLYLDLRNIYRLYIIYLYMLIV